MKYFILGFFTSVLILNGINSTLNTTVKLMKDFSQFIRHQNQ